MRFLYSTFALPCLVLLTLCTASARANTINGSVYCNYADAGNTPAPGTTLSSGTLCAIFQTDAINFMDPGQNTLGSFLNSNGTLLGPITYENGYTAASNLDMSLFEFTGSAYFVNGQQYSATHDDGTVMVVDGVTVINSPGATASITSTFTFTGLTGNYDFQYNYTEAQGGSTYQTNATDSPVPEPSSLALLGTGVLGAAFMARRRLA